MTRDEYVESIKSAFKTVGSKGVYAALVAAVPFFGLPVIGTVTRFIIDQVIAKLVDLAEMEIFFVYIDLRTAEQRETFESAARANWIAQQAGSPEEKANAEAKLIASFRSFAKFNL